MTFEEWKRQVDAEIWRLCGLGMDDLADQTWWDWWHDEVTPAEAARRALNDEGFSPPLEWDE